MLDRSVYLVKEHVGLLKFSNTYDIFDPETKEQIGIAQEKPGSLIFALRFLIDKKLLPTKIFIYEGADAEDHAKLQFSIHRGITLLRSQVDICDPEGKVLGWMKSKIFSLGGGFDVFDAAGNPVASVKGDWKGWNFRFVDKTDREIGTISKKWAGLGKELFTSADTYVISLTEGAASAKAVLLLAAGLAVDTVFKER